MQVVKVLNTSVVLAVDKDGEEVILMGKGIGFRKSIGEEISVEGMDKVFVLRDRTITRDIIQLAAETDAKIFGTANEIIDYAKNTYHMELMDHIYLALTDHLAFAVRRAREGMTFPGFYSLEVKRFHPKEFDVGCYGLRLVEQQFGVRLPEAETGNIAFHFINAQKDQGYSGEARKMIGIVRDISEIVKYTFGVEYDEDTIAYSRFIAHLQALAQRILQGSQLAGDIQDLLGSSVEEKCRRELLCVQKISDYLNEHDSILLTKQEELYLAIHIYRVLEENPHRES